MSTTSDGVLLLAFAFIGYGQGGISGAGVGILLHFILTTLAKALLK